MVLNGVAALIKQVLTLFWFLEYTLWSFLYHQQYKMDQENHILSKEKLLFEARLVVLAGGLNVHTQGSFLCFCGSVTPPVGPAYSY